MGTGTTCYTFDWMATGTGIRVRGPVPVPVPAGTGTGRVGKFMNGYGWARHFTVPASL